MSTSRPILFNDEMVRAILAGAKRKKLYAPPGSDPTDTEHLARRLANGIAINEGTGCWEWQRTTNGDGYGMLRVAGKMVYAHRLSYEIGVGPIPAGLHILHRCDNPRCINPEHLSAGTRSWDEPVCHLADSQFVVGRRFWVREAWRIGAWEMDTKSIAIDYRADSFCRREWIRIGDDDGGEAFDKYLKQSIADAKAAGLSADEDGYYHWKAGESPCRWRPSIHMPRWASRITLEITDIRCQRLQDISEEDCWSEGIEEIRYAGDEHGSLRGSVLEDYRAIWDSIAKPGVKWSDNPWVWAISFKRVEV